MGVHSEEGGVSLLRGILGGLAGGALLALGFMPTLGGGLDAALVVLGLVLLANAWLGATSGLQAFFSGMAFAVVAYGGGLSWLYLLVEHQAAESAAAGGVAGGMLLVALVVWALLLGLLGAVCFGLRGISAGASGAVIFGVLWLVFEWVGTWLFGGIPLLPVGNAAIDSPFAGYAPVLGALGVSVAMASVAGAMADILRYRRRVFGLAVVASVISTGYLLRHIDWTEPMAGDLSVSLIHGDLGQQEKHQRFRAMHAADRYLQLSEQAPAGTDLIIWPESSMAYAFHTLYGRVEDGLQRLSARGTAVFLGAYLQQDGRLRNVLLDGARPAVRYEKRHLIPGAEYRPWWGWGMDVAAAGVEMTDLQAGADDQQLLQVGAYPFASMICFESLFGAAQRDAWRAAGFSVVISDLSWFAGSNAAYQLSLAARMRALESGKPVLLATNQGLTMAIDRHGQVIRSVSGERARLDVSVRPRNGATPYSAW